MESDGNNKSRWGRRRWLTELTSCSLGSLLAVAVVSDSRPAEARLSASVCICLHLSAAVLVKDFIFNPNLPCYHLKRDANTCCASLPVYPRLGRDPTKRTYHHRLNCDCGRQPGLIFTHCAVLAPPAAGPTLWSRPSPTGWLLSAVGDGAFSGFIRASYEKQLACVAANRADERWPISY